MPAGGMKFPQTSNNLDVPSRVCEAVAGAFPIVSSAGVSALAFLISGAAWRALVRSGNPNVRFVVAAFLILGLKNLVKAALLVGVGSVSLGWEVAFASADVAMVAAIAWPLLSPRGGAR